MRFLTSVNEINISEECEDELQLVYHPQKPTLFKHNYTKHSLSKLTEISGNRNSEIDHGSGGGTS